MNNTNHNTRLSEHFSLEEFTYSRIAVENGLDNTPPASACQSVHYLVTQLLEPLRNLYGKPIAVLSGYRKDAVNRLAGGVANSQHTKGEAADCYIPEGPETLLALLQRSGLAFDQAIVYKSKRFLHLSLKSSGRNRMQVLFYMLCVICLLSGCGMRRTIQRTDNSRRSDSLEWTLSDSILLEKHSVAFDLLSAELLQIVYLPPDSSGRQGLQSINIACLHRIGHTADSLISAAALTSSATTQQTYSSHVVEQVQSHASTPLINYFPLFLLFLFLSAASAFFLSRRS